MFTTYILYSAQADKYYVGYTNDLSTRIRKHNNKNKGFTNQSTDWTFVFQRDFTTKAHALAFEKEIKSWKSRVKIQKLISSAV